MVKKLGNKAKGIFGFKVQLLSIGLLIFLLYVSSIRFGFVGLDDTTLIVDNYQYVHDLGNLKNAFLNDVFYNPNIIGGARAYYRPIITISLMLDSQIGGRSPKFYHFINILLHIISCFLLFRFFQVLKYKTEIVFSLTLIFAVHPMLSQAISWIPGRNDSLLTIFIIASLICFIRFLETDKINLLIAYFVFFAFGLFTKETALFLPILIAFYLLLIQSKKEGITIIDKTSGFLKIIFGTSMVVIIWYLLRQYVVKTTTADLSIRHLSDTFFENLPVYFQVIQKVVFPYNLSIMSIAADTNFALSAFLVIAILAILFFSKQKQLNYILFGFVWFNVFLLPAFVVPILTGFEHRAYLPLIGILIVFAEMDYFKKLDFKNIKSFSLLIPFIIFLVVVNFNHTPSFANKFSFWEKAANNSPHSALAKLNYGLGLAEKGRTKEALTVYREGLRINPKEPMIHNNIGAIFAQQKLMLEAEKEFKMETVVNPTYADAFYNLGIVYDNLGNEKDMMVSWQKAIELNPNHVRAQNAINKYIQKNKPK